MTKWYKLLTTKEKAEVTNVKLREYTPSVLGVLASALLVLLISNCSIVIGDFSDSRWLGFL